MNLKAKETIGTHYKRDIIFFDEYNIPAGIEETSNAFKGILSCLHKGTDTRASITMTLPGKTIEVSIKARKH